MDNNSSGEIIKTFKPAVRSAWFLFFGLAIGPAIMLFERDPDGHPGKWIALSLFFLALIFHRLSLKYTLTGQYVQSDSWWGLGRRERVGLASVRRVRPTQSYVGRLVGCGHLEIESDAYDEPGLLIMGQPDYLDLARQIEALAALAKADRGHGG